MPVKLTPVRFSPKLFFSRSPVTSTVAKSNGQFLVHVSEAFDSVDDLIFLIVLLASKTPPLPWFLSTPLVAPSEFIFLVLPLLPDPLLSECPRAPPLAFFLSLYPHPWLSHPLICLCTLPVIPK